METLNKRRVLVRMIKELEAELSFQAHFLSEDWIIVLSHNNRNRYIYGYDWGINSAAVQLIAKDKTAAYEVLALNNISAIEHKLFCNYAIQAKYTGKNGCWNDIMDYAGKNGSDGKYNLVCKPNKGTGGNDVYHITNRLELESTVQKMFSKYQDLCLCPFYNIDAEYRAIVLDGEILLLYLKERPYITGNGKDNLAALIVEKYKKSAFSFFENNKDHLESVPGKDEVIEISWKHNLGSGAKAVIVKDASVIDAVTKIVRGVSEVLDVKFASIDVVSSSGIYYIMEINSGVMVENFALQPADSNCNYYETAKSIYRNALKYLFQQG